jgi:hypothetical protein
MLSREHEGGHRQALPAATPALTRAPRQDPQIMGKLTYGNDFEVEIDDRTLAHLQLVIGLKMRRSEGFFFSWTESADQGNGRTTLWLSPAIPLAFTYFGGRPATINREWLETLTLSSNSSQGLQLTPESLSG